MSATFIRFVRALPRSLHFGAVGLLVIGATYRFVVQDAEKNFPEGSPIAATAPVLISDDAERQATAHTGFSQVVAPFVEANCLSCHGPERQKGHVRFDQIRADPLSPQAIELWARAAHQLEDGAMPPESQSRPDPIQQTKVLAWMREQLERSQPWASPPLRRLSRIEYANALTDLLGIREDLSELLPEELGGNEGFTNEAERLQISTHSVESYLKAAQRVAASVIQPVAPQHWTLRIDDANPWIADGATMPRRANAVDVYCMSVRASTMVFFDPHYADGTFTPLGKGIIYSLPPVTLPAVGTYRVRMRACGVNRGRSPARLRMTYADISHMSENEQAEARADLPFVECNVSGAAFADMTTFESGLAEVSRSILPVDRIKAIDPILAAYYQNAGAGGIQDWLKYTRPLPKAVLDRAREKAEWVESTGCLPAGLIKLTCRADDMQPNRWLFVPDSVELEGPLPRTRQDPDLADALAHKDTDKFVSWLAGIMSSAYRRPVPLSQADAHFKKFHDGATGDEGFAEAARLSLAAVLCSPEFLTVPEKPRQGKDRPRELTGRELATRMSLFLWRGLPDQALLEQADTNAGLTGAGLDQQVERMLNAPQFARFVHDFNEGWLGLGGFESVQLDPQIFPRAQTNHLRESLRREPDEFMAHLFSSNASILDILNSEWVVLNQRLAEYYHLSECYPLVNSNNGEAFRVIPFPKPTATFGTWSVAGPFRAESAPATFNTAFEPEQRVDLNATYRDGMKWTERPDWADGAIHDLTAANNCVWYLTRTITAPTEQDVQIHLESEDGCRLWLDGVETSVKDAYRPIPAEQDLTTLSTAVRGPRTIQRFAIHVSPGEHRLLMKRANTGGPCYFSFDPDQHAHRGGILDMGAMLMQTSQATRTSPVRRGVWFLENILGTKPPPPPPKAKAQALRSDAAATGQLSARQVLELHRSDSTCASCHARFDPFGFALENYGPDGLWRTNELLSLYDNNRHFNGMLQGPLIDPSGTLQNGSKFKDLSELKNLLTAEPKPFVQAFARKLLAFAVGRKLEPHDNASVDAIVQATFQSGFHARAVLKAVVACDSFQKH